GGRAGRGGRGRARRRGRRGSSARDPPRRDRASARWWRAARRRRCRGGGWGVPGPWSAECEGLAPGFEGAGREAEHADEEATDPGAEGALGGPLPADGRGDLAAEPAAELIQVGEGERLDV